VVQSWWRSQYHKSQRSWVNDFFQFSGKHLSGEWCLPENLNYNISILFMNSKTRIVVAEDHLMIRKAMELLLGENKNIEIVGEASNGKELINLLEKVKTDIILLDIFMPEMNGIDATSVIRNRFPWIKIIVLSVQTEFAYIKKLFTMGVSGYVTKNSSKDELFEAISLVQNGKEYLSKDMIQSKALASEQNGISPKPLSKREIEIIKLIQDGLTNKEISEKMFISLKTVESHRTNIFRKLRIKNVAELLKHAHQNLLLSN